MNYLCKKQPMLFFLFLNEDVRSDGRTDGRTVGGRPGRVRDLNSLLGGFGLVVGRWTCSGVKVDLGGGGRPYIYIYMIR